MNPMEPNGYSSLPIVCSNLLDGVCSVASDVAGNPVTPTRSECEYCSTLAPPRCRNMMTLALARRNTVCTKTAELLLGEMRSLAKAAAKPLQCVVGGPGTELKKLISWFYIPDTTKCRCNDRVAKMDAWGPDVCEERLDTIIRWLRHSASVYKVPFQETVVRLLVKRAITNARNLQK